ncbi:MAG: hypothetical protein ACT4PL_14495 [Phycisphaerales bacterium]
MPTTTRTAHRTLARLLLVLGVATLCGCARSLRSGEVGDGAMYPEVQQSEVLDIQVFRDETEVRFTNTTARSFGPSRLWLNQWFSRPIDGLEVGQSMTLDLRSFEDRYGDGFRAGGFFATELPDKVVLAQLENDGRLLGMIVVENR